MICEGENSYSEDNKKIINDMKRDISEIIFSHSISRNCIVQLIPIHEARIELSESILRYTSNREVIRIACKIITENTQEIADMCKYISVATHKRNDTQIVTTFQNRSNGIINTLYNKLDNLILTERCNCNYIRAMIQYYECSISLIRNSLLYEIHPQIRAVFGKIAASEKSILKYLLQLKQQMKCHK